jgi:hypothetical protein
LCLRIAWRCADARRHTSSTLNSSLVFEVNADHHVAGAPADAFFESGGGGYGVIVVPSLDLVTYKMAGSDSQYDPGSPVFRKLISTTGPAITGSLPLEANSVMALSEPMTA